MKKGESLKALSTLHKTMLMGQLILIAFSIVLVYVNAVGSPLKDWDKLFQVIAIALAGAGFFIGSFIFKRKLAHIKEMQADLKAKFEIYRSASVIKWALLEGPCLASIFFFLLTGNYAFLALAFVLIILFNADAPVEIKIADQLDVSVSGLKEL